jgi:tetratricopeptide (TPR) repeat protein
LKLYQLGLSMAEENLSLEQCSRLHGKCGVVLVGLNRHDEGIVALERSVSVFAAAERKGSPAYLIALQNYATICLEAGRFVDAEGGLIDYLAMDPRGPGAARSRLLLAKVYHTADRPEDALTVLNPGIADLRTFTGLDYDPSILASALWLKAIVHRDLEEFDLALDAHLEAIEIFETVYGEQHPRALLCGCAIAMLHMARNELGDAWETTENYLPTLQAILHRDDLDLATPLHNGAMLEHQLGVRNMRVRDELSDVSGGETILFPEIEQILFKSGLSSELENARSKLMNRRATVSDLVEFLDSAAERHLDLAEARYLHTASIFQKNFGEKHPTLAKIFDNLSELYDAWRLPAKSVEYSELADAIRKANAAQLDV